MNVNNAASCCERVRGLKQVITGTTGAAYHIGGMRAESWIEAVIRYIAVKKFEELAQQPYFKPRPVATTMAVEDTGEEITFTRTVYLLYHYEHTGRFAGLSWAPCDTVEKQGRMYGPGCGPGGCVFSIEESLANTEKTGKVVDAVVVEGEYKSSKLGVLGKTYDVFVKPAAMVDYRRT